MALKLYARPELGTEFSSLRPFTVTFDGTVGGAIDKRVYLRNDNKLRWYSNIQIQAVDLIAPSRVTGTKLGYSWQLAESDTILPAEAWDLISKGNILSLSSGLGQSGKGDIITFLPIWVRVTVPSDGVIQTVKDIILRVTAKENLV